MSGHSKWHNIQAKKGKADAARGKLFTKIGRELAVAAKGNPNPSTNSKLADVIAKAKAANMPNDNIERSIKRAAGDFGDRDYKELTYEGYGVGGAAVIITTLTDNNNRTAGDVRAIMSKHGGSLGTTGSVSYMFDNKGVIVVERTPDLDEDTVTEYALDAGAEDVVTEDDAYEIYTTLFRSVVTVAEVARGTLDGALDVVVGHIRRLCLGDDVGKLGVGGRIGVAFCCDCKFSADLGEELAARGVRLTLLRLDIVPFAVS